ncbi:MAG TPA: YbaK/EbsC family protein [Dehalococcoidia bacterium]|nr:YbaK/EbsC family protein [Dehalococcoidia bacterium]
MNPCLEKLRDLFDRHGAHYELVAHPTAYTAQEAAQAAHVPGHEFCKSVVVYIDGKPGMLVLPAPHVVSIAAVRDALGARDVRLATEKEMAELFPDCDVGAQPPFGGPWRLPVYVDSGLLDAKEVVFEAGLHTQAVMMPLQDYLKVASPRVLDFAREPAQPSPPV